MCSTSCTAGRVSWRDIRFRSFMSPFEQFHRPPKRPSLVLGRRVRLSCSLARLAPPRAVVLLRFVERAPARASVRLQCASCILELHKRRDRSIAAAGVGDSEQCFPPSWTHYHRLILCHIGAHHMVGVACHRTCALLSRWRSSGPTTGGRFSEEERTRPRPCTRFELF